MHRNWQDLITPKNLETEACSETYGKFVAKPLERGYGLTLGNSLRRVLLSSLNGAAIVAIRIVGVDHEFSTIPGVKEDVTDLILNLKQVNMRYRGNGDATVKLKASGQGVITAGQIETSGDVEILNPEQVIAHLDADGKLDMEMVVRLGRGYVSAEANRSEELPVGMISIDSIFAPVRRVSYSVSNARVGQMTDYDKLTLEVWTNGAERPDDALAYAAKILKEQLTIFVNFDEVEEDNAARAAASAPATVAMNDNLYKEVSTLELSVRAANCLENANIKFIGELVTRTEAEMLKTKNFGRKSLNEIKDLLAEMGLSLGMKIDGFDPSTLRSRDGHQHND
ncbi:MAG: DNA-directed RNA polymerase subunit alpha [bacterium]|jgi:DNA-directed RNA polymerase subunit alpha